MNQFYGTFVSTESQCHRHKKHGSKLFFSSSKMATDRFRNRVKLAERPPQSLELKPIKSRNWKKYVKAREPAVLTHSHQACQEQWARMLTSHSERFGKAIQHV